MTTVPEDLQDAIDNAAQLLRSLCEDPQQCLAAGSPYAELSDLAQLLQRRVKAELKRESRERDREASRQAPIRQKRRQKQYGRYLTTDDAWTSSPQPARLAHAKKCYICKQRFAGMHPFYDALCPSCGDFNYQRRTHEADLRGRIALVTGGRIKIGFQIALRLLRCGATVSVTSRFPFDAAYRYAQEPDFDQWCSRLKVFSADFRYLPGVVSLCDQIARHHPSLDILINNAAQTVRRPPEYYRHLVQRETELQHALGALARQCVLLEEVCDLSVEPSLTSSEQRTAPPTQAGLRSPDASLMAPSRLPLATWMSQARMLSTDGRHSDQEFPEGEIDADGQQLDLRSDNSWNAELSDVAAAELLEVHAVNSLAPFFIIQRLEPLLLQSPHADRYVVNVTAMEGQLSRDAKTGFHPHTNMAKAGMNMITRTCADRYADRGVYMNSVDTGWVTNEFPGPKAKTMEEEGFEPPLDEVDGAARVCDPVFRGVAGDLLHGKFLKDYFEHAW